MVERWICNPDMKVQFLLTAPKLLFAKPSLSAFYVSGMLSPPFEYATRLLVFFLKKIVG